MNKIIDIQVSPKEAADQKFLQYTISEISGIDNEEINGFRILKRSVDARSRRIKVNLRIEYFYREKSDFVVPNLVEVPKLYKKVQSQKKVLIVGAGPAGLFAALRLIELGIKPILLERGKNVRDRRRDLAAIHKQHVVNPNSNYCFGEGGAGTYSDGKLYTRSTKRGDVNDILKTFVSHGAEETILIEAHPHIGTNKLPQIIMNMRESILNAGGEIHFNTCLQDLEIENGKVKSIRCLQVETGKEVEFTGDSLILATGHSASDIYELLHKKNILLEAKPFAMGVRIEHPQELIDEMQYHCKSATEVAEERKYLPAASYSWVEQVEKRGVFSFCMCPGGIIAPCATAPGEVVTNGWSPSKRNNPFANSGIVVALDEKDFGKYKEHGPLAGLHFRTELEKMAFLAGGSTQTAPAQRLMDFIQNKISGSLPLCSYQPGVKSAPLHTLLPAVIGKSLQHGFLQQGKKMPGYLTNEAIIVGVESRTSTPVRIPRDKEKLHHPQLVNLFPCGEGAGFAGGIVSAAIDGQRCAEMAVKILA